MCEGNNHNLFSIGLSVISVLFPSSLIAAFAVSKLHFANVIQRKYANISGSVSYSLNLQLHDNDSKTVIMVALILSAKPLG